MIIGDWEVLVTHVTWQHWSGLTRSGLVTQLPNNALENYVSLQFWQLAIITLITRLTLIKKLFEG